jgi:hypothetical protein
MVIKRWLLKDNDRAPAPKEDLGLDEFGVPRERLEWADIDRHGRWLREQGVEF